MRAHRGGTPALIQILQQAAELDGFIDMPLDDIVLAMVDSYGLEQSQVPHFRRRVRKTKNIPTRNRAKGRRGHSDQPVLPERKPIVFEESSGEKDTQEF